MKAGEMDTLKKVTLDHVLSWKPCGDYTREKLLEISEGRTSLTPLEILALDIPVDHRFWVLLREEIIPEKELHLLACDFAARVLLIWEKRHPEDKRPRQAIEAKRKWVADEIDDDELAAAWGAAADATGDTTGAAAWAAAWAAAGDAARDAARDAAWAAAWAAAWDAWDAAWDAWAATGDAARGAQIDMVKKVLQKE